VAVAAAAVTAAAVVVAAVVTAAAAVVAATAVAVAATAAVAIATDRLRSPSLAVHMTSRGPVWSTGRLPEVVFQRFDPVSVCILFPIRP
jgi:hypothetical protein